MKRKQPNKSNATPAPTSRRRLENQPSRPGQRVALRQANATLIWQRMTVLSIGPSDAERWVGAVGKAYWPALQIKRQEGSTEGHHLHRRLGRTKHRKDPRQDLSIDEVATLKWLVG